LRTEDAQDPASEVEGELEEFGDPEGSPSLPATTLGAAIGTGRRPGGYREIGSLAWPFMLNLALVNLVGLIDIVMVGRLGSDAVAAVGYAGQFFFLVQSVMLAVGASCVALVARALGAGDPDGARAALAAALAVSVSTAFVLVAATLAAPHALLELLGAPPQIADASVPYMRLLLGSSLLLAVAVILECGLRADRDTRTPMWIALAVMLAKVGLNLLLIFGALGLPRLELVGAGIATAVSQVVGLALFFAVVRRAGRASPLALVRADFAAARPRLRQVIAIALPGVGERLAMNLALLAYFRILSEYGPLAVATYTVGIRVLSFSWIPGISFGVAASTLVGHNLGAGHAAAATRAGWRAARLALGVAVVLGSACALARAPLAGMLTREAALVSELIPFLLCLAVAQPFLQVHFALGGALRGAGDTFTPFVAATVSNWALRVPLALLAAQVLALDVIWVWYTLVVDHLARAAWMGRAFRRGGWRRALQGGPARA